MPRGLTSKIIVRQRRIFEFIENEICVNTKQVIETFGLTHSQAFYVLQMLRNQGLIEEHVVGKMSMWCVAGHVVNDMYVGVVFIPAFDIERAICEILENERGRKVTIRVSWIADKIAEKVHVNPRQPLLLTYISEMLSIMLSNVDKIVFSDSRDIEYYVVDTCSICNFFSECPMCEELRKKLNC
jgi:hypothetical protein